MRAARSTRAADGLAVAVAAMVCCVAAPAASAAQQSPVLSSPVLAPSPILVRPIGPSPDRAPALDYGAEVASVGAQLPVAALRADGSLTTLVSGPVARHPSPMLTLAVDPWTNTSATGVRDPAVAQTRGFTDVSAYAPGQAGGVDGYDWHIIERRHSASAPAATRLIALDDVRHLRLSKPLPSSAAGAQVIPTGRGVRIVTRRSPTAVMTDSGRIIVRVRGFSAKASIGLADGSVLLSGTRRVASASGSKEVPAPMRRVSASETLSVWHPGFPVPAEQTLTPLQATSHGVLYLQTGPDVQTEPTLIFHAAGGHTVRRSASQLGIARSSGCMARGIGYRLTEFAGPAGRPIARLDCVSGTPGSPVIEQSTMAGLDNDLQVRWTRDLAASPLLSATVGPEGTLIALGAVDSQPGSAVGLYSAIVPDALPIPRGKVIAVHAGEPGHPYARLQCAFAEGRVCNGTAELVARGKVVAHARYAMRARPGPSAAVVIRHFVDAPTGLRGHLSVRLRPVT